MILINIDSLSTTELQYIAQQEGLENWQTLEREELIDELEETYGEQDDEITASWLKSKGGRKRFCNALTDFRGNKQDVNGLPGVEDLPDVYAETSIHLLMRDPVWAYAYWSLSPATKIQVFGEDEQLGGSLFLRVFSLDLLTYEEKTFDIAVGVEDTQWNINLPAMGNSYKVTLCYKNKKGLEMALAESSEVSSYPSYWVNHYEEMAMDSKLFNIHFSSLVTKEGEIVDNAVLQEIAQTLSGGVL
ncbi:DUF4912 domain-containing protein [Sphaerochaeta sp. PS]|uniref:DUF4912 domain-containing protein n=1 Tax=Sphaerochaeta sp. PS TaxID=3076336 RepID=UPI0028A46EB9|nr:DUF4912 domain-containing protein [Sphaerochaeta sp. PS]MDT4762912.1 DUF4912 domain-containing protein [Sphaerochaeta sp. PS]